MCVLLSCIIILRSLVCCIFFFFQAEDGIRDLVRSRGLGDVYKRQVLNDLSLELLDIVADERYTKNRLGIKSEDYIRNTNLIIIKIGELLIKD